MPTEVHSLSRGDSSTLTVQTQVRPSGQPDYKVSEQSISIPEFSTLAADSPKNVDVRVEELYKILKEIPSGPPGVDIYGLNIGLAFGSDSLEWSNSGPEGCGGGAVPDGDEPTEAQKAKFKRAVEIVKGLADP